MSPRGNVKDISPEPDEPMERLGAVRPAPQFYVAEQPLFAGGGEAMPARAFNPGDHVHPELVTEHNWHHLVREPTADELVPPAEQEPLPGAAQEE